jgi:hypothetical protein
VTIAQIIHASCAVPAARRIASFGALERVRVEGPPGTSREQGNALPAARGTLDAGDELKDI